MIQNVFQLDDIFIGQICTHRMDMVCLEMEDTIEDWEKIIFENRHSFYPVCEETKDEIIGILDVKDFFRSKDRDKYQILEYDVDAPYFVPETMRADVLLRNMKQKKRYFAVVIDEYGGVNGIVTLHDLIEELVGEIDDEEEESAVDIEKVGENQWRISGSASVEKVAECLQLEIPFQEYEIVLLSHCKCIDLAVPACYSYNRNKK